MTNVLKIPMPKNLTNKSVYLACCMAVASIKIKSYEDQTTYNTLMFLLGLQQAIIKLMPAKAKRLC